MATVFLIRHAEAEYPRNRIYGFLPVPLSSRGREQARGLARFCAENGVERILASPLARTRETAGIIAEHLGKRVETDDRLREWDLGHVWQGMSWAQIARKYPRSAMLAILHPERISLAETIGQSGRRLKEVIEEEVKKHPDSTIAVVSHGDPIGAFWNISLKRPMWMVRRLIVPKASILRLTYDPHGELTEIRRVRAVAPPPQQVSENRK